MKTNGSLCMIHLHHLTHTAAIECNKDSIVISWLFKPYYPEKALCFQAATSSDLAHHVPTLPRNPTGRNVFFRPYIRLRSQETPRRQIPTSNYKNHAAAPIGPFALLSYLLHSQPPQAKATPSPLMHQASYTPELFPPLMALGAALLHQPDFAPGPRELASLAVTAVHTVPFVQYAHTRIAIQVGFSEAQVSHACEGANPEG